MLSEEEEKRTRMGQGAAALPLPTHVRGMLWLMIACILFSCAMQFSIALDLPNPEDASARQRPPLRSSFAQPQGATALHYHSRRQHDDDGRPPVRSLPPQSAGGLDAAQRALRETLVLLGMEAPYGT
jgi:hypothetical protein